MEIRPFVPDDEASLFTMLRSEGEEWRDYWGDQAAYLRAMLLCTTFVAVDGDEVCGFARCWQDSGFGVHVIDLLVSPAQRGRGLGRRLMEAAAAAFPGVPAYVHSDVDPYYEKLGYARVGSLFEIPRD